MIEVSGIGAYGIVPFLSEDLFKQAKYANIKTRAGKLAYVMSAGEKTKKPQVQEGVHEARGALKWIAEILKEGQDEK